jgi:periplasmic protein TonB
VLVTAALISAVVHAGLMFGFGRAKKNPARKPEPVIALTLHFPEVKELEDLDPVPADGAAPTQDLSVPVPMQADLPQVPRPSDFVQQIDFASLIERPDFSNAKILTIPENIRRGTKIAENLGNIFNLADLDREPVPILQPAPLMPAPLRREGIVGTVRVQFIVDTEGRVLNAYVVESTEHRFDDAAIAGVSKWKFRPGMKAGRKVNTRMAVPIVFNIVDRID